MKNCEEIESLLELSKIDDDLINVQTLGSVKYKDESYPLISFQIGSKDIERPCLGLFGGIHGLEKIGTQVILAYLSSLFAQMKWDKDLRRTLSRARIVSIPLINPIGMSLFRRSNGNSVDLMRNAPIEAKDRTLPLISGHRLHPSLPWYRGDESVSMEKEAKILCQFVEEQMFPSQASMSIDFHSGFGMKDRLWFPFARSKEKFPHFNEVQNIKNILNETLPHHIYTIEPQSDNYTTHGDLWDYLYLKKQNHLHASDGPFIPWTLEMGSWLWIKKNPLQVLSPLGFFHPIKGHRTARIMRRHLLLIDLFFRTVRNRKSWLTK